MTAPEGILLVHKPPGMTSHDVVEVARRRLAMRRIGHTGTLDPMAEGLLVLLVGAATKRQQDLQTHDKAYDATVQLGIQTDTGDAEGRPVRTVPVPSMDAEMIGRVLREFTGPVTQTPPAYSAVKVGGRPAYWWARRRQPVALKPRTVHVAAMTLLDWTSPHLRIRVECSSGTYVRALGEAIAQRLGTAGHLTRLVRLRVGAWNLDDAKPLAWFASSTADAVTRELRPVPRVS
jgi:tRNA pseudouridine55 synthase